jgi:two-component system, chemotaxis family, CheB/CheR fusion protein
MTKKKKTTTKKEIETSQEEQLQKTDESSMNVEPIREEDSKISLKSSFPIVGIGASAGGLAAFEAFFSGMPTDTDPGMAFVLVQHLAPDHKSILSELIKRYTRMQVFEVEDGMKVQPNCTYIIPPNRDMALLNGTLQLMEPSAPHGMRLPIDFFFRSLAKDQRERAICIVLSGTGSDGTLGVRAIKGEGGIAIAQNLASTEYDGMPRSAIDTGLVDYELPPAEMPAQLIKYVTYSFGRPSRTVISSVTKGENSLKKIFILLSNQTGHDFSQYKPSTINRRIERRLAIHQIETIDRYVKYLQQTPVEVEALFHDLLIGVTNFFRDPEAFQAFKEQVIPKLFDVNPVGGVIRVWLPGCSTGEEAYSIAILMQERMEAMKKIYKVQIFATDVDSQSIVTARNGFYPASITTDLSPERLARFFVFDPDRGVFRIHKTIRDMLIFSEQDVIKDPPFSKLNLISCRNLLIYMTSNLQKYIIPLFHYALNPGGFLFLGISETVGEFSDLFTTLDHKLKLYQRREGIHSAQCVNLGRFLSPITATAVQKKVDTGKMLLREMTEQMLLQQLAPVGVLVNDHGDILYIYGRTGPYLEPAPGEVGINNILKMAREGLRYELTMVLHKAVASKEIVRYPGLRIKTNGDFITVNLAVHPVEAHPKLIKGSGPTEKSEALLYLVILEQVSPFDLEPAQMSATLPAGEGADGLDTSTGRSAGTGAEARLAEALKKELRVKDEYLQTTNEDLESSNEELQSTNEELQSTNEELETSKEELQSLNEELDTVNVELQTKVVDLSRANDDMNNLLAGTGIGTVFVDRNLHILRFTPAVTGIINLIQSDVGRPVSHIVTNLVGYDSIVADIQAVLDSLISKEVEVQTLKGVWYAMRILPYRTQENVIEGAVITFVDISEIKKIEKVKQLAMFVRDAQDAIILQDLKGCILNWNPAAVKMYGWSEAEALTMNIRDLISKSIREKELAIVQQLSQSEVLKPYRAQRVTKDGRMVEMLMTATAVTNEAGEIYAITTTAREIRKRAKI